MTFSNILFKIITDQKIIEAIEIYMNTKSNYQLQRDFMKQ